MHEEKFEKRLNKKAELKIAMTALGLATFDGLHVNSFKKNFSHGKTDFKLISKL